MNRKTKMIITTTPNLDGWEIEAYLGTVSSHVVAGTGLFSDMFAGIRDIFGGRSLSYQRQLSAINSEAIELLKQKATLLGANCIVGLRIDHDEISGKGKSMFMITAVGTAVKAKQLTTPRNGGNKYAAILGWDEIQTLLRKEQIVNAAYKGILSMDNDIWKFVIENQIHEIAPVILNSIPDSSEGSLTPGEKEFLRQSREYFFNLPEDEAKRYIYEVIKNPQSNETILSFAQDIIKEAKLMDFQQIGELLDSGDFKIKNVALGLLRFDKSFYKVDDIVKFENILEKIKSTFKIRASYVTEKSKLSSKIKKKWICECGKKNDEDFQYCSACGKDIYGFMKGDESHPKHIELLISKKIAVLKKQFLVE